MKKIINKAGFELLYYNPENTIESRLVKTLNNHGIDLIFDVGANNGQYSYLLFKNGFKNRIISFEPVNSAHRQLTILKNRNPKWDWIIHKRTAIGDKPGKSIINIAENDVCSSLLPVLETLTSVDKTAKFIGKEDVKVITFDDVFKTYTNKENNCFLKIDTQGFEGRVLKGGSKSLKHLKGIQIEMSLIPLYRGDILFDDIYRKLRKLGFKLDTLIPVCVNNKTGKTLQVDCVFFKD